MTSLTSWAHSRFSVELSCPKSNTEDGKDQVVILSHELWQRQLDSDPHAVGKSILLNLRPYTIVGVMPENFPSLPPALLDKSVPYRPVAEQANEELRSARHLRAIGRLKEGVTLAQAQSELSVIAQRARDTASGVEY